MKQILYTILLSIYCIGVYAQSQTTKPNVIVIVVDDLNDWVKGFNGHEQTVTPNLAKLEKSGTTFINTHCPAPICGPSRTSFLSGKSPDYTKDYTNSKCVGFRTKFTEEKGNAFLLTMPEYLKDSAGYYTYNIGKVFDCHSNNVNYYDYDDVTEDPCAKDLSWSEYYNPGFSENPIITSYAADLNVGINQFSTCAIPDSFETDMCDYLSLDKAIEFISGVATGSKDICDKPFAMFLGIRKPHIPWLVPERYFLPYYDSDYTDSLFENTFNTNLTSPYNGVKMPPQPAVRWEDYYNLPDGGLARFSADIEFIEDSIINRVQTMASSGEFGASLPSAETLDSITESLRANMIMAYLAGIKFMDAQVGRLMKELKKYPEINDNTIIVLVGDNAFMHGEKRHWSKVALWEGAIRVPMIIADYRNPVKKVVSQQVSILDVYPTIVDMINGSIPKFPDGTNYLDGHSLKPLMSNPMMEWESPVLSMFKSFKGMQLYCNPQYSVKENDFHLIRYQSNNSGSLTACDSANSYYEKELYEVGRFRNVDPFEWNNLISDSSYDDEVAYLEQFLPGGSMYLMKSMPITDEGNTYPCFYSLNDRISLHPNIYDVSGNLLTSLPENCIYEWKNSLNKTVQHTKNFEISASELLPSGKTANGKFYINLAIVDTVLHRTLGYQMFAKYTDEALEPELSFETNLLHDGFLQINDISLSGSFRSVEWNYGDGTIYSGEVPPAHYYEQPGEYQLEAKIYYGNSDCEKIISSPVSVSESAEKDEMILAYPNPADTYADLFLSVSLKNADVQIISVDGKILESYQTINENIAYTKIHISTKNLPVGYYTVKINDGENNYEGKILVVR